MPFRLLVVILAAVSILPVACLRQKKESSLIAAIEKSKLPAPSPPLPTSSGSDALPQTGGVQPPAFDRSSPVPALPGMPGTASQPIPPATVPDSPQSGRGGDDAILASADDEEKRKGLLERIKDRRQDKKEKETPKLPPATEPREPMPLPVKPDALPRADARPEPKPSAPAPAKETAGDLKAVRELLDAAKKKNDETSSFEAHLVKREVVKGKELPAEEAVYRFRKDPLSVHIKVTGDVGTGREVMWVKGQNDNKMTIVTGKGDNILLGAGKKMTMDPDDPLVTAKSRYRIYEAGMQRPIGALTKFVEQAEAGKRSAESIRSLGPVERKEYGAKLNAVEVKLTPDDDKFLPKGGKRVYHFDADPKSPSCGLPVLVISLDHEGKEVEYYCFTNFKQVGELTDADFDPSKIGKKR